MPPVMPPTLLAHKSAHMLMYLMAVSAAIIIETSITIEMHSKAFGLLDSQSVATIIHVPEITLLSSERERLQTSVLRLYTALDAG